ncbi:MAG: AAA family ATPase, partial [Spirochaetales bacterium]|nr:AAA family ATPase [Spirochaetales bacterium]
MRSNLEQFTQVFSRAIQIEMAEMKRRLGTFEISLGPGKKLPVPTGETIYKFDLPLNTDKLVPGVECELRFAGGSMLVSVQELGSDFIVICSKASISLTTGPFSLVVYPWFLYERLIAALERLAESGKTRVERDGGFFFESAFRAFGKIKSNNSFSVMAGTFNQLNESQKSAIRFCLGSDLAFVWGPPGTGKTSTLACLLLELLGSAKRVLVASTTNAAVDQVLEKLNDHEEIHPYIDDGQVLRTGNSDSESYGARLSEISERLLAREKDERRGLYADLNRLEQQLSSVPHLREMLEELQNPDQYDLFELESTKDPLKNLPPSLLREVFDPDEVVKFAELSLPQRASMLGEKEAVAKADLRATRERISIEGRRKAELESRITNEARLTLTTMAAMYVNPTLLDQRYDVVIIEEAGMAVLPAVFYCACIAKSQVFFVGDPKQLPPIVQSKDPFVYRAMGRSIFEVTAPDPIASPVVALLDVQYRMHPEIGNLISSFFYNGVLRNAESTVQMARIADIAPFCGSAITLVDMKGLGTCEKQKDGFSRFNSSSAAICVDLAAEIRETGDIDVAIITPYVDQSRRIRALISERRVRGVECRTIHRFQGGERDVVIFDMVDTYPLKPGILLSGDSLNGNSAQLLNVSFSRARGKLIV